MPEKQEKAFGRVKNFRSELGEYRTQLDRFKQAREETVSAETCMNLQRAAVTDLALQTQAQNRTELLGRRPHNAVTPENPYANTSQIAAQNSPFRPANASALGTGPQDYNRESHAFREKSFAQQANAQLDEFLERGRNVLGDLGQQREVLKGTQKRLYSVGNTLGISGDTIRMVERRAKQDKWIFWGGVIVFFLFCYLVLRFLR